MQVNVTFRHVDPSEPLRSFAQDKLSRLEKYLDSAAEAHVVLSVEKFRHTADITVSADGWRLKGVEQTEDLYSAIDLVIDKLESQVSRRLAKRRTSRQGQESLKNLPVESGAEPVEEPEPEEAPYLVTERIQVKPMDVEEALEQLTLTGEDFLVFNNARTTQVNVLYRRKDGHIGLIEPY